MEKITEKNIVKTEKGIYYEIIKRGQHLITGKRLDKKGFLHLTVNDFEKNRQIYTIYNTKNEIKIIKNRIRKEKLKKQGINVEEFAKKSKDEKRIILENKKGLSEFEKIDLIKIDYKEKQEEIKTTLKEAVTSWVTAEKIKIDCMKRLKDNNKNITELCDQFKI